MDGEPLRREGLGYVYEPLEAPVRVTVDYLARRSDELSGEVIVESRIPGVPPHLHQARFNLTSTSARKTLATHLDGLTQGTVGNWPGLLEAFCAGVLRRERQGEPFERVGGLAATRLPPEPPDLITDLIPSRAITLLYGLGGAGKGWLATFAAVCVCTGTPLAGFAVQRERVLYLDWEDDKDRLDRRIVRVSGGLVMPEPPEFDYRRCGIPLREQVHQIAEFVAAHEIGFIIFDSVEAGAGAFAEHTAYEARAADYFAAIRNILTTVTHPVTALCIDHVSDQARQTKDQVNKPIGALLKGNRARMAWEVRNEDDEAVTHLGLYQFKANHSERRGPYGLKLDFSDPGRVYLEPETLTDSGELSRPLPAADQLAAALMPNLVLDTRELVDRTGLKTAHVRVELNRNKRRFTKNDDGRWSLRRDSAGVRGSQMTQPSSHPTWTDDGLEQIPF